MSSDLIKSNEKLTISFSNDNSTVVDIYEVPGSNMKSISRIMPMGAALLIAEIGTVGMLQILNYVKNNQAIETRSKYIIVGTGPDAPSHFKIGMQVLPKMVDTHILRKTFDPNNDYSFESLVRKASDDKSLLAAVAITGNKDRSRVGLRLDMTSGDVGMIEALDKNSNPRFDKMIYSDKAVPFLNYKVMDYQNVDAVVFINHTDIDTDVNTDTE